MAFSNIEDYGIDFQTNLIALLLSDKVFYLKTKKILTEKIFAHRGISRIKKIIDDYYDKYLSLPSLAEIKIEIGKSLDNDQRILANDILNKLKNFQPLSGEKINYIKDEILEFCNERNIEEIIYECATILEEKSYNKFKKIEKILKRLDEIRYEEHVEVLRNVEHFLERHPRNPIDLPWEVINNLTHGGISEGELFIVAAPPGAGKSHFLINVGSHVLKRGKNVLHVTLELSESYTAKRYYSCLTQIDVNSINEKNIDLIKSKLRDDYGKLIITCYPTKTISVSDLHGICETINLTMSKIDIVIVDYADLLKSESAHRESWQNQEEIYYNLRGMAGKLKLPVVTAAQIGRTGINDEFIESDKLYGNFSKVMISDVALSMSRTTNDKLNNTARFLLIKNRFGQDGIKLYATIDTKTSTFNIFPENSKMFEEIISRNSEKARVSAYRNALNQIEKDASDFISNLKNGDDVVF